MGEKKEVVLRIFNNKNIELVGRCLGYVTAEEYADIVDRPEELLKKLYTVSSSTIKDLSKVEEIEGLRLAIALSRKGNKMVLGKEIFFTQPLNYVCQIQYTDPDPRDIAYVGTKDPYITVEEREVCQQ